MPYKRLSSVATPSVEDYIPQIRFPQIDGTRMQMRK
jgi:hypothetical protein